MIHDLIPKYENNSAILKGIKELELIEVHPKFSIGQIITFYAGYHSNIRMKTKITGFNADGGIYLLWDCYWADIKDNDIRKIKIISSELAMCQECLSTNIKIINENHFCNKCNEITNIIFNTL